MRIERIDDKTVKCFLSNEELEQYDIDYKDFVLRNEKAKEVVQEIIEQAQEEVGYKPPKFAFDLQIMMLPDQGLLLTFSEKEPDGEQLVECLKEMKKLLLQTKEKMGLPSEDTAQKNDAGQKNEEKHRSVKQPDMAVFAFSRLRNVMDYAALLPANLRVESELYEMDDIYFLFLRRGHASQSRYSRACIQAMEFGGLYTADESRAQHLREQGTCLISEKAVKKLRG